VIVHSVSSVKIRLLVTTSFSRSDRIDNLLKLHRLNAEANVVTRPLSPNFVVVDNRRLVALTSNNGDRFIGSLLRQPGEA